jgi:hypothetical protein
MGSPRNGGFRQQLKDIAANAATNTENIEPCVPGGIVPFDVELEEAALLALSR